MMVLNMGFRCCHDTLPMFHGADRASEMAMQDLHRAVEDHWKIMSGFHRFSALPGTFLKALQEIPGLPVGLMQALQRGAPFPEIPMQGLQGFPDLPVEPMQGLQGIFGDRLGGM